MGAGSAFTEWWECGILQIFCTEQKIEEHLTITDENGKETLRRGGKKAVALYLEWTTYSRTIMYKKRSDKASMPLCYKERKNWERVLTLACSHGKKATKRKK